MEIDHADRASRRRIVERTEIEIGELIGREERETAAPDRAASKIVGEVVVRCDPRPRADPDTLDQFAIAEIDVVRLVQAFEIGLYVDRRQIDGRCVTALLVRVDAREDVVQARAPSAEVHPHRLIVKQTLAAAGLADVHSEGTVAPVLEQVGASSAPSSPDRLGPTANPRSGRGSRRARALR